MRQFSLNRWWAVGAGALANAFGAGPIMVYGYSIMAEGMVADFGWTRADSASFFSAFLLGQGLGIITLGWLISRLGVRLPAAALAGIFGITFAAIAVLPPDKTLFWGSFLLFGFGGAACTALPWAVALSGTFDKHRGLALGLVVAGSGISAPLLPQIATILTDNIGWRSNFVILGSISAVVSVVGLSFFVKTPPGAVVSKVGQHLNGRTIKQIYFANPVFWYIGLAVLLVSISTFGGLTSLVGFLKGRDFEGALIANVMSVAAIFSLFGRVAIGHLLDKLFAPWVSAVTFAAAGFGFIALLSSGNPLMAFVGGALIAIAIGSEADILSYLVSRYFPLVEFSRVVSIIYLCWAWGGVIGTLAVGASLNMGYGYGPVYILFGLLLLLGAALLLLLGPYRYARREADSTTHDVVPILDGRTPSPTQV